MTEPVDYGDINGAAIMVMRGHMKHAGLEPAFADDGVHLLVIELLEFRRLFNDGEALDVGKAGDQPLCRDCGMMEAQHSMATVQCGGYVNPVEPPANGQETSK